MHTNTRRSTDRTRTLVLAVAGLAIACVAIGTALVMGHETSVRNVYDEFLFEGPECAPHLALPGRSGVVVPAGFKMQGSSVDFISDDRRDWGYEGDGMDRLLAGESYESQGLYLTFRHAREGDGVDIYADSGFTVAADGNGYCLRVDWTYDPATRTLEREMTFLRDDGGGRHQISADEFLSGTVLAREDVERWAGHGLDDLVVSGYLEANEGRTRFAEGDLGTFDIVDVTDWDTAA